MDWIYIACGLMKNTLKNNHSSKGNQWLHPDIVAMQAMNKEWTEDISQCVKLGSGQ
ncbi:hypothetical protein [Neisseria iguanae]|uniref:hypothetical protein n=1 Tax=Neisseria iguanae TaxID=90242 RepID=UPI001B80AD6F|nr:hypothetical protein [Neisseria iguanae]